MNPNIKLIIKLASWLKIIAYEKLIVCVKIFLDFITNYIHGGLKNLYFQTITMSKNTFFFIFQEISIYVLSMCDQQRLSLSFISIWFNYFSTTNSTSFPFIEAIFSMTSWGNSSEIKSWSGISSLISYSTCHEHNIVWICYPFFITYPITLERVKKRDTLAISISLCFKSFSITNKTSFSSSFFSLLFFFYSSTSNVEDFVENMVNGYI